MRRFLANSFQIIGVTMIILCVVSLTAFMISFNPKLSPAIITYGLVMLAIIFTGIIIYAGRGMIQ